MERKVPVGSSRATRPEHRSNGAVHGPYDITKKGVADMGKVHALFCSLKLKQSWGQSGIFKKSNECKSKTGLTFQTLSV